MPPNISQGIRTEISLFSNVLSRIFIKHVEKIMRYIAHYFFLTRAY